MMLSLTFCTIKKINRIVDTTKQIFALYVHIAIVIVVNQVVAVFWVKVNSGD